MPRNTANGTFDAYERRNFLLILEWVLTEAERWQAGEEHTAIEVMQRSIYLGDDPDMRHFVSFACGWATCEHHSPYVRELELRSMPYRDYLQTPEWQERRQEQLERDGYRCRLCNSTTGLQVHHRTYENRGAEMPGDLTTVCGDCHWGFHQSRTLAKSAA
jgi:hypothetical protein